ncbi:MAG: carboxylating nicotinate-nucleotide diphosphorylase [Pseudomonadota bacterium]|nr:carboxylating nicotinate-nucleotide diphosphorylase [Pseudomonadota bacterium]
MPAKHSSKKPSRKTASRHTPTSLDPSFLLPSKDDLHLMIEDWVAEDVGLQDLTTNIMIPAKAKADFLMNTREDIVISGIEVAAEVFRHIVPEAKVKTLIKDGVLAKKGTSLMRIAGPGRGLLTAERTSLNVLQFMCGIATLVREYASKIDHTEAQLIDTRKTVPGMRMLSKYSACVGGCRPHRLGLHDGVMIKDNHIAVHGSITKAVAQARALTPTLTKIEVECDTLKQVEEAAKAGADVIMFDNMSAALMKKGIEIIDGRARTEASGGIRLDSIKEKAECGVDFISVGRMTQSAPAVDIGLDVKISE